MVIWFKNFESKSSYPLKSNYLPCKKDVLRQLDKIYGTHYYHSILIYNLMLQLEKNYFVPYFPFQRKGYGCKIILWHCDDWKQFAELNLQHLVYRMLSFFAFFLLVFLSAKVCLSRSLCYHSGPLLFIIIITTILTQIKCSLTSSS